LALNNLVTAYNAGYSEARTYGLSNGTVGARPGNFSAVQVSNAMNQAFGTLRTNYTAAQTSVLSVANGGAPTLSTVTTFAALHAFTAQQISQFLTEAHSFLAIVPASSIGLLPFMQGQSNGNFTGSLQQALSLIPGNTGPNGKPGALYRQVAADALNSAHLALNDLLNGFTSGANQGLASTPYGSFGSPFNTSQKLNPGAQAQVAQFGQGINRTFTQFQAAFQSAMQNVLFANASPGANGQVNLSKNQAAFLAKIGASLNTLNGAIRTVFASSPVAGNSFLLTIGQNLLGSSPTSLQGQ